MRLGNAELANAVIGALNGRMARPHTLPIKAVHMRRELQISRSYDNPGLIQGQARVNHEVWDYADVALTDA